MSALENASDFASQNLQKAIDDLRRDITKVEMWADALNGFAQPVPDYDAAGEHLLGRHEER